MGRPRCGLHILQSRPSLEAKGVAGAEEAPLTLTFFLAPFTAPAAAFFDPELRAPGGDDQGAGLSPVPDLAAPSGFRPSARRPALKAIPWQPLVVAVGGLFGASLCVGSLSE